MKATGASRCPHACSPTVRRPRGLPGGLPGLPAHCRASQECGWTGGRTAVWAGAAGQSAWRGVPGHEDDTLYCKESEATDLRKRL